MKNVHKTWLLRAAVGGLLGAAAHLCLGYLLGSFSLFGPSHFTGFVFPWCGFPNGLEWLGVLLSFALWIAFGAELGVATLPFANNGRSLVARSLAHYLVTAATVCLWAGLNVVSYPSDYLAFLVPLTLVYLLIWLGRWVGWYTEVMRLRTLLGLDPGPTPLKWRETLPYLSFVLLVCDLLPPALGWADRTFVVDVPVLSGLILPCLLLPAAGLCSGASLGRRHGLCPLYPLACFVCYLPMVWLLFNGSALFHCFMIAVPALAGNVLGWLCRRAAPKKKRA